MKINRQLDRSQANWNVAELGSLYGSHRFDLYSHAHRILKDGARAEEVVQDAFIKVMLAAPELASEEHAVSYLHRTIENLCIDIFRLEGRRPNLVALDESASEIEARWQDRGDHSEVLSAAEDAAIIRQALALLSPAERTALVMWEMDGRTTSEIATELGIKESSVRHTVSRARASLRQVLSTIVVDQERGLTALDLLSTTYKKTTEVARKSGKVAMSLVLIVAAILSFNSFIGDHSVQSPLNNQMLTGGAEIGVPTQSQQSTELQNQRTPLRNSSISVKNRATLSQINDLEFVSAQLESDVAIVEAIQLISQK